MIRGDINLTDIQNDEQVDKFYWSYNEEADSKFGDTAEDQMLEKVGQFISERYGV